jgi:hypothetical protein
MNLSFSHAFNPLFPHIKRNGKGFETPIRNFGCPVPSSFHNCLARPSLGLHKTSIELLCIASLATLPRPQKTKTNASPYDQ